MSSYSSEQDSLTPVITLRPVGPEDAAFLLEVYASTRADEMALVPWNDEQQHAFVSAQFAAQQEHYAKKYPEGNHSIILANGRAVGRLYLARLEREMRIVDITVLPGERNAGFGSCLLRELLDEAGRRGKVVRIYVENFNPSLRFFERLGFSPVDEQGVHLLLEWSPLA